MACRLLLISICIAFSGHLRAGVDIVREPRVDSVEGTSICDAMREFVQKKAAKPLPERARFRVKRIAVSGSFCSFEGYPLASDGGSLSTDVVADVVFETALQKVNGRWNVIYDLTRTDVPSEKELKLIRARFPEQFPTELLPDSWRDRIASSTGADGPHARSTVTTNGGDDHRSQEIDRREAELNRRAADLDLRASGLDASASSPNATPYSPTTPSAQSETPTLGPSDEVVRRVLHHPDHGHPVETIGSFRRGDALVASHGMHSSFIHINADTVLWPIDLGGPDGKYYFWQDEYHEWHGIAVSVLNALLR